MKYQLRESPGIVPSNFTAIQKIFYTREITDLEHYLHTTEDDVLNPLDLKNMAKGAELLLKTIKEDKPMFILVDCDADGFTSSAILINYINKVFPTYNKIIYKLHEGKQHGLKDQMEYLLQHPELELIVVPDAGSNDYEEHKILSDLGKEILIIDHHNCEKESEHACVINNQLDNYQNKTLSGAGVVYKFCTYLDNILSEDKAEDLVDLAIVGIIADVMNLRNYETRYYIEKGIANINNPFVKTMANAQKYSIDKAGGLSPFSISFYIAPQINATIRMGDYNDKEKLFKSMLESEAFVEVPSTKRGHKGETEPLVVQVIRSCNNIKNKQQKARDSIVTIIEAYIEEKQLYKNKIIAVKIKPDWKINKNLTGLIANILMSKYRHPILLLNPVQTEDGLRWEGSGRGLAAQGFSDLQTFLKSTPGLVEYAEGHGNALGTCIKDENFEDFINYSNLVLKDVDFSPFFEVDFIWNYNNFNSSDIIDIATYNNVWGEGIPKPFIVIENIPLTRNNTVLLSPDKNPTLKITLPNGVNLMKFKSSKEEYESLFSANDYMVNTMDIVGECTINEWGGNITGQILVQDFNLEKATTYNF